MKLINNFENGNRDIREMKIKRKHVDKLPTMKKIESKSSFE